MSNANDDAISLADLKARIEAEALLREAAQGGFTLEAVKAYLEPRAFPPELVTTPPPPTGALHLRYFSAIDGRELVNACYSLLLKRAPDAGGMRHWLAMLGQGVDKAVVVGSIAYSAEGRQRGTRVRGLFVPFALGMAHRVPLAGALLGWIAALLLLPRHLREARGHAQRLHARMDSVCEYVGRSRDDMAHRVEMLRSLELPRD